MFFFQIDKFIIISFLWFKLCVIFSSFRTLGNQLHDEVSKQVKAFVETQSKARKTVDIFSKPITLLVLLEKSTKKRDCSNFWFYWFAHQVESLVDKAYKNFSDKLNDALKVKCFIYFLYPWLISQLLLFDWLTIWSIKYLNDWFIVKHIWLCAMESCAI